MGNKKTKGRIKLPEIVAIFLVILLVAYVYFFPKNPPCFAVTTCQFYQRML